VTTRLTTPQLTTDPPWIHTEGIDPGGDHAGRYGVSREHGAHRRTIPLVEQPRSSKPQHIFELAR
jgi:hypothetical protein